MVVTSLCKSDSDVVTVKTDPSFSIYQPCQSTADRSREFCQPWTSSELTGWWRSEHSEPVSGPLSPVAPSKQGGEASWPHSDDVGRIRRRRCREWRALAAASLEPKAAASKMKLKAVAVPMSLSYVWPNWHSDGSVMLVRTTQVRKGQCRKFVEKHGGEGGGGQRGFENTAKWLSGKVKLR